MASGKLYTLSMTTSIQHKACMPKTEHGEPLSFDNVDETSVQCQM